MESRTGLARLVVMASGNGSNAQAVLDACARVLFAPVETKVRLKARHGAQEMITATEALKRPAKKAAKPAKKPARKGK